MPVHEAPKKGTHKITQISCDLSPAASPMSYQSSKLNHPCWWANQPNSPQRVESNGLKVVRTSCDGGDLAIRPEGEGVAFRCSIDFLSSRLVSVLVKDLQVFQMTASGPNSKPDPTWEGKGHSGECCDLIHLAIMYGNFRVAHACSIE